MIRQDGSPRVVERQTLVYRSSVGEPVPEVIPASQIAVAGDEIWLPDPVRLFRFSAASFNSQRIQYDGAVSPTATRLR